MGAGLGVLFLEKKNLSEVVNSGKKARLLFQTFAKIRLRCEVVLLFGVGGSNEIEDKRILGILFLQGLQFDKGLVIFLGFKICQNQFYG